MSLSIQLVLRSGQHIPLQAVVCNTAALVIPLADFKVTHSAVWLNITHAHSNTQLHVQGRQSVVVVYLNDALQCAGAAYAITSDTGPLDLLTAYKNILLLPYPTGFALSEASHILL